MKKYIVAGLLLIGSGVAYAQTTNRTIYQRWPDSTWICGSFEDDYKIIPGSHPDIIMFVDMPKTETRDRQICILAEERGHDTVEIPMTVKR